MNDQTAHDVTGDERRKARNWAELIEPDVTASVGARAAARVILNAVPAPPRPTLAGMTEEERAACQWMQCDAGPAGRRGVITNAEDWHVYVVDKETGGHSNYSPDLVTPRPDLPRLEWPGSKKVAPDLPGDWRVADHKDLGRVIVTNPTPDCYGTVYFAFPRVDLLGGLDWKFCDPDELTYLDTDQEADQ